MTEPEHPRPISEDTPAAPTDGGPAAAHGDPLLAASRGATEGVDGTRHGLPPTEDD